MMTGSRGSSGATGGVKRADGRHYNRGIDILLLCTGNVCRSPMAEALLRHRLAAAGVEATVSSAGVWREGEPASGGSVKAMATRGLVLDDHRSRLLALDLVGRADLVIGMAREHVREVVALDPPALAKTFTMKELVRRSESMGSPPPSFERWLSAVGEGRRGRDLLGASPADDVEDPIGRADGFYRRTAAELEDLIDRLVPFLVSSARMEA